MRRTGSNGIIQITQGEECKGSRAWATANLPTLHVPLLDHLSGAAPHILSESLDRPLSALSVVCMTVSDEERSAEEMCFSQMCIHGWVFLLIIDSVLDACKARTFATILFFFSFFLFYSDSAWCFSLVVSLVSAERVHQVIHNQTTPTPRPTELNTQFLSHHRPHLHLVLTYDWAEIVSTIYRCKQLSCFPV